MPPAKKTAAASGDSNTGLCALVTLDNLKSAKGAIRQANRVGRGRASGSGKTCNRGHNGEGQRSGRSRKRGFEGGQMPGYRRLPKLRFFERAHVMQWLELNVKDLPELLPEAGTEINYDWLRELRLLKPGMDGLRILGNGEISQKITIQAHYVSPSAKAKIEAAGGQVSLVNG